MNFQILVKLKIPFPASGMMGGIIGKFHFQFIEWCVVLLENSIWWVVLLENSIFNFRNGGWYYWKIPFSIFGMEVGVIGKIHFQFQIFFLQFLIEHAIGYQTVALLFFPVSYVGIASIYTHLIRYFTLQLFFNFLDFMSS